MSIRTKIDFSGITSDNIVTSDNKKYIHEDDEIFNSLKDEIAACENAQVQTEIATLQILEIKEQTKVIANEAIDTATERAESAAQNAENAAQNAEEIREEVRVIANEAIDTATERAESAAQNAETAQALAETAAINALEAERNVTEFSETFAKLDGDNAFTGDNSFTGKLLLNGKEIDSVASGHNIGEQWISMDGTIPMGGLAFLGQTVSKETYIELYNWVETNNRFKTEEEWQSLYTANNGNVSFYAKVDDNTFRLPSFKGYLKANTTAGGYTKEGLPNIVGNLDLPGAIQAAGADGALSFNATTQVSGQGLDGTNYVGGGLGVLKYNLNANRSSSIYGNSSHVTPETNTILIGVYAFNTIINPSNLDVENLRLDVESLGLDVESLRLDNLNYVTKANGEISTNLTVTAGRDAIFRKNGSRLYLCRFDDSDLPGSFILRASKNENCTSYVDLQGHSNGNLTWGGKSIITLAASWRSGDNWYRKYSDGFIEQGGSITPTDRTFSTVSFHVAFSNKNYSVCASSEKSSWHADGDVVINNKNTTYMQVSQSDGVTRVNWQARGY